MKENEVGTVIVTGSSRGIGAAIAIKLAERQRSITVTYTGQKASADDVIEKITAAGGTAIAVQCDVSRSDDFRRLFDESEARFGPVDMLVNCAGLMSPMPIAQTDDDAFDRLFAVNVRGVFNGCKLAATRLSEGGAIVNLSTSVIGMSPPGYGPYCASKAAVEAITRSLSKELGSRRIRVNAVAPGPTDTELLTNANDQERLKMFVGMTPLGRLGHPEDIAGVIAFLASSESGWINGQTLRVNGGMIA